MSQSRFDAAQNFARRKRIGPFAETQSDPDKQRKQLQAFLRAGHDFDLARRFVYASPGDEVEPD
jgi:regulatory protein